MENIYKQLGSRIREIRKKKSLTLEELSDRAELDWSFLARIETGKAIPSIMSLSKISKALNVSITDLFSNHILGQDKLLESEIISLIHKLKTSDKTQLIKILKTILPV
ncbi:MAG: helix-turn-helix transcriptional regulator [Elusimicrobia bacterium]|nr:helix-turn-helix transcriptional regulator [Elusimicrobiota bacterium]